MYIVFKKLFTVHILAVYRALFLFEKRDKLSEFSLERGIIEQK